MSYISWDVKLNDVSIADKVSAVSIQHSIDSYCLEVSLQLEDVTPFADWAWESLVDVPSLEVLVQEYDEETQLTEWVSLGEFFVERPVYEHTTTHSVMRGIWGRSKSALLGAPFATKLTKSWSTNITLNDLAEELCEECGVSWNASNNLFGNYDIPAGTVFADEEYPIEILAEVCNLLGGPSLKIVGDVSGSIKLVPVRYDLTEYDVVDTIQDLEVKSYTERFDWPDFANRVKVTGSGGANNFDVQLSTQYECLLSTEPSRTKLFARVTDKDGVPLSVVPVTWSLNRGIATLD